VCPFLFSLPKTKTVSKIHSLCPYACDITPLRCMRATRQIAFCATQSRFPVRKMKWLKLYLHFSCRIGFVCTFYWCMHIHADISAAESQPRAHVPRMHRALPGCDISAAPMPRRPLHGICVPCHSIHAQLIQVHYCRSATLAVVDDVVAVRWGNSADASMPRWKIGARQTVVAGRRRYHGTG
jgi:hypothetical protein